MLSRESLKSKLKGLCRTDEHLFGKGNTAGIPLEHCVGRTWSLRLLFSLPFSVAESVISTSQSTLSRPCSATIRKPEEPLHGCQHPTLPKQSENRLLVMSGLGEPPGENPRHDSMRGSHTVTLLSEHWTPRAHPRTRFWLLA